jgi:ribosomal peptide maturation radical SAM protein 1
MPFAETSIPSIQLTLLESYLKERNINVKTNHLYLKAAEFYGLNNYNSLINSPNDAYTAQMVFSKYIFTDHWGKNLEKFKYFYENIIGYKKEFLEQLSFEKYIEQTDNFIKWSFNNTDWESYDIIGFTLNYGQFLPSLALSKIIKEAYPEKIIVFGGSTTINELGKKVLKTFGWIDFIVSGEGEEPLFLLASDYNRYKNIPGLIYRNNKEIIWNCNEDFIDLNSLPYPDLISYYQDLNNTSNEVQQYYQLYGRLPIELSRGCWWNNCTFCNVRAYNKKYREKNVDRFVEELDFLSNNHRNLSFQVIGNTLPQNDYKILCKKIIELGKDFDLYIEARAGRLKSNDYELLKKAGFNHIQTGVETFSPNYIKKMNKGTRVIDNIAALKYCKENKITNTYNIIVNYPNEELVDFEESKQIITLLKRYIEPPQVSTFFVGYNSPIYNNLEKFNIEKLEPKISDTIMYPPEALKNDFLFFYQFKRKQKNTENNWKQLMEEWKDEYEKTSTEGLKRKTTIDQLVFYYVDGIIFLKIYDKRIGENVKIYDLDKLERDIFLSCIDVTTFEELKSKFSTLDENELREKLNDFTDLNLIFTEDEMYLSLPLSYNKLYRESFKETEKEVLIT